MSTSRRGAGDGPRGWRDLLAEVSACTLCAGQLEDGVRPVLQLHPRARLLIAGQAPGRRVHASGVPFDDPSGERLLAWTGLDRATLHAPTRVAILPMGFCFPGSGPGGDRPPRPECAPAWRARLLELLGDVRLTLLIGRHAMGWHLGRGDLRVTETVAAWRDLPAGLLALPHPSPRNNRWLARHPWFEAELVPVLRRAVAAALE